MGWFGVLRALFELLGLVGREVHDAEQRKAGSDESQLEATNAEINRVNAAADAAGRVPVGQVDPDDRDK